MIDIYVNQIGRGPYIGDAQNDQKNDIFGAGRRELIYVHLVEMVNVNVCHVMARDRIPEIPKYNKYIYSHICAYILDIFTYIHIYVNCL